MCLFPLFRCCNDVDQIKQRLNFNAKRYECMPNPLNKWSLATRTPDPYKGNSTLLSFTESRTRCNSFGGELISIHNAFQNGLLAQMQNDRGWLGAVRDRTDHPWFWMDQTPFDYQRFQSQAAGGYCAYLDSSDQLWKIVDCNSEAMYALCAAQPVDQTTQAPTVCQAGLCCKSGCTKYSAQPPFYLGAFLVGGRKIVDHYDCGYGCYPGAWLIAKPFTVDVFPYLVCKKR
ncbi:unnamed protein product, partial [Mesorhabditis belari]|uniref:C-type lectin domain-containing protein n=1 Tax=Mesorhabditis belari TaxID=2138241 RepID=A0AAF3FKP2_9BILA